MTTWFRNTGLMLLLCLSITAQIFAQDETEEVDLSEEISEEALMALMKPYQDSMDASFTYQTGTIELENGIATLNVPEGFRFLDGEQSKIVLTDLWGNPPSECLGMLFLDNTSLFDDDFYAIELTYDPSGYVKDKDAEKINYDKLLKDMQKDIKEENEYRLAEGYGTYELVGWAAEPFYDKEAKKLHWAKDLVFDESDEHTLNYAIRVLGRKGVLQMNFISSMDLLSDVEKDVPTILASVNFNEGNTYADFDPGIDKVAAYGIGGLIAGKILAKAGFFALLLKFWKIIAVAVVAGAAGIRRFFTGKDDDNEA